MDAYRHGNEVTIDLDLPGADILTPSTSPSSATCSTICATREWDHNEDDEVFTCSKPTARHLHPPRAPGGDSLDSSNLQASYDHGVLTVTLPVSEQAQPRKIVIGSGERPSPDRGLDRQMHPPAPPGARSASGQQRLDNPPAPSRLVRVRVGCPRQDSGGRAVRTNFPRPRVCRAGPRAGRRHRRRQPWGASRGAGRRRQPGPSRAWDCGSNGVTA